VRGIRERSAGGVGVAPGEQRAGRGIYREVERREERAAMASRRAREVEDERDVGDSSVGHVVNVRGHRSRAGRVTEERQRRDCVVNAPERGDALSREMKRAVARPHLEHCALFAGLSVLGCGGARDPGIGRELGHNFIEPHELRWREEAQDEPRRR